MRDRKLATTLPEEARYVNFGGGRKDGEQIADVLKWLTERGVAKYAQVVPGALIRST